MSVASWCWTWFCVVLWVRFCTGHFVMLPLNLTYLHCLQHSLFEHLFNLYYLCICSRFFLSRRICCCHLNVLNDLLPDISISVNKFDYVNSGKYVIFDFCLIHLILVSNKSTLSIHFTSFSTTRVMFSQYRLKKETWLEWTIQYTENESQSKYRVSAFRSRH